MIPLTHQQRELLDYLKSCEECPSFEEMMVALDLKSKSGVHRLIAALEERGFIRRIPNRARAIEIVNDDTPKLPTSLSGFTREQLAAEAKRRGLVLGNIYRDAYGARKFESITA